MEATNAPTLPSQQEMEARFRAMANQRNNALDEAVFLAGQCEVLTAQVADLQRQVAELKAKLEPAPEPQT